MSVPPGVTSLTIATVGGTGGNGDTEGAGSQPGGQGAVVTATVAVNPGDNLTVTVAGNGSFADGFSTAAGGFGAGTGGEGSNLQTPSSFPLGGGTSGGGGSAVFDGTTPLAVAGGGGGGGFLTSGGNAGAAAYPGGQAGSQTAPGKGGPNGGSDGIGMNGGNGAAGGGGGYYGGGGGGTTSTIIEGDLFTLSNGAGGGSNYPTAATEWDASATPSVTITTSASDFLIATDSLPNATPGTPYGPVASRQPTSERAPAHT